MAITGIFFGSDTGNTENIAKMIQKQLGKDVADVHDIAKSSKAASESMLWFFRVTLEFIWHLLFWHLPEVR